MVHDGPTSAADTLQAGKLGHLRDFTSPDLWSIHPASTPMTVLGSPLRKMRLPHNTSWRLTCTNFPHPAPTTARPDDSILFAALELSKTRRAASAKSWLVATSAPGEEKVSKRTVSAGDAARPARRRSEERRVGKE